MASVARPLSPTRALCTVTGLAAAAFSLTPGCGLECKDYDGCGEYVAGGRTSGGAGTASGAGGALVAGSAGRSTNAGSTAGGTGGGESGSSSAQGDGGGGAGGADAECDVSVEACVPGDAIFVARGGSDTNAGTYDAPVATLREAIERASAEGKRVIACAERFDESVVLTGEVNAGLEGGYQCEGWRWKASRARTIVQPSRGVPLTIRDVQRPVLIQGLELLAPAGVTPGANSVGAIVTRSNDVVFRDVRISADEGQPGANGATEPYPLPMFSGDGGDAMGETRGGEPGVCTCACEECAEADIPVSRGGKGGDRGPSAEKQSGGLGLPDLGGGLGGVKDQDCPKGGGGARGADAPPVESGLGATTLGTLTPEGEWRPAAGNRGKDGKVAQGGGGGRASEYGGGGGGGCGGCGGRGGAPGGGGGASIGLVSVDANVTLIGSRIETAAGGSGGVGAPGQPGQLGGAGGDGARYACNGGDGGTGSTGGFGGSGAGGSSIGVLFTGPAPNGIEATSFRLGPRGRGGAGEGASAGIDGVSVTTLAL